MHVNTQKCLEKAIKMAQLEIDEVYPKVTTYPMIVNFQNGYTTDSFLGADCTLLENEKNGKKTVTSEIDNFLYAGEECNEDLGKTMILARNRKTGKVRLIEVGYVELKPLVKNKLDSTQALDSSYLELSRKFGSKKHKQIMEHREKLKVNVQTVTEQMQNVTMNITVDQIDLSSYNKSANDDFYVPPIKRKATKVEDVYDLHSILRPDQYDKIYNEIENTDYLSNMNSAMKKIVSNNWSRKQTVLALYANTLFQFYSVLMKEVHKKGFVLCKDSQTLNEHILNNFTTNVNGKRGRSPQYRDKALCHAFVCILLINNYQFDLEPIAQLLKLSPKTIATKLQVTGASIVASGNKKIAQLKLPLHKPLRRKSSKF